MPPRPYVRRLVDRTIATYFAELPALMLTGPRAAGKTTTAAQHARRVVRLDQPAEAITFRDDPDVALRTLDEPVVLDEWQAVPEILGAVKRAVDEDPRPGRFLLTGSVHADLRGETWPGTGRVVRLRMEGLTLRERNGQVDGPPFLQRLADGSSFPSLPDPPDLADYAELGLRGGFPEPVLELSPTVARGWLRGYVEQLLTRDADSLDGPRDPALLRRYFEAVALSTAGLPDHKSLYDAAGIDRKTAVAYDRLLTNLFVLDLLPPWTSNRLSRLTRGSKRHLIDTSLVASVLELDLTAAMRDGDMLGRLLESFVLAQIRPETQLASYPSRLYHLRDRNGRHEVDVVAVLPGGDIVGIEVKASAAPSRSDARHLEWLRDRVGDRFRAGAVLHTGPRPFKLADGIAALPIYALWS
jgi:hypothetical protein